MSFFTIDKKVNIVYLINMTHPIDRRSRKRQERTQLILATAQTILLNEGLEAVTVHRIARELDLTVGALYRYFPSKQAMLTALGEDIVRSVTSSLGQIADIYEASVQDSQAASPLTPVLVISRAFIEMAESSPARYRMVDLMLVDPRSMVPEEDRPMVLHTLFEMLGRVEQLLKQSTAEHLISAGQPRERTIVLWSALLGINSMLKMRRLYPEQVPAKNLGEDTITALFVAWGCDASVFKNHFNEATAFLENLKTESNSTHEGDLLWRSLS
jgi:AcrR family transcriptional regulator